MEVSNNAILRALRTQAWERAKGELKSMLHTYYSENNFYEFKEEMKNFIKKIEDNGWQE